MTRRLLPLLLCLCFGCTRTSPPSAPPVADEPASTAVSAPVTIANDGRPVIAAFGDSLTAGYGADPGKSYPDFLQKDLDHLGYKYRVVNAGISGMTTKDGVDRLQDVIALKPVVVIVAFGGNDGLRGLPITSTRDNLDQMLNAITQSGAHVVLGGITLPPNYGPDYIRQFNETYALAAKKYHAPWIPFLLNHVFGTPGGMQEDGIHATSLGNEQVARNILPLVLPLLKKPR